MSENRITRDSKVKVLNGHDGHGKPSSRWLLISFVLVALGLRLVGLSHSGYDQDELGTIHFAQQPLLQILFGPGFDTHPPAYYAIMHVWISVAGESEYSLRLPSALLGSLAIWLAFSVGRELLDDWAGWGGAIGLGLLPTHIAMSQDGRMYELFVVLALLSVRAMMRLVRCPDLVGFFGYLVATLAMIYTETAGVFLVISQNVFFAIVILSRLRKTYSQGARWWVVAQFLLVILSAPWLLVAASKISAIQNNFWVKRESIFSYLGGLFFIFSGTRIYPSSYLLAPAMTILIVFAAWKAMRKADLSAPVGRFSQIEGIGVSLAVAVVPGLAMAIISQYSQPIFVPRTLFPSAVACYWLAGYGISLLDRHLRMIVASTLFVLVMLSAIQYALTRPQVAVDLRVALENLGRKIRPGDTVYLHGWPEAKDYWSSIRAGSRNLSPMPRVLTSRQGELDAALRDWCSKRDHMRLLVMPVSGTDMHFYGLIDNVQYTAILKREKLLPVEPTHLSIGRVNIWRCKS